jgi:preprotein translocase subunit SecG
METVIIVIHLMVIVALIALVLMQRSEGGALGIGGGGNFMSSRGQGNVLTRSTAILAAAFFATSIALTVVARLHERPSSILDSVPSATAPAVPTQDGTGSGTGSGPGILDELQGVSRPATAPDSAASAPAVPATAEPAASAPTTAPAATTPETPAAPSTPQVPTSQ